MKKLETSLLLLLLAVVSLPLAAENTTVSQFWKARENRPYAVAFDGRGSMYVVTAPPTGNGLLSRVTPDGATSTIAVLEGSFIGPGIDIDDDGLIYVTVGDKLIRINQKGGVSTIADGFIRCMDVALDHRGNAFVVDDVMDTVYRIAAGKKETLYDGGSPGSFIMTGLAFDGSHENLYIRERDAILRISRKNLGRNNVKPEIATKGIWAFSLRFLRAKAYVTVQPDSVFCWDGGKIAALVKDGVRLSSPAGIAAGGKGFDENSLYVAVSSGIVRIATQQ